MRRRISSAAFLVKVTARIRAGSTPCRMRWTKRPVRVLVLRGGQLCGIKTPHRPLRSIPVVSSLACVVLGAPQCLSVPRDRAR
jgi:hypothetical protein